MHNITESPFAHLFGTNGIPSDDEASRISKLISKPVEELRGLNDEITRLLSRLDELRLKRDGVQAYVDAHRGLLTPVRRLPPDLLGEIFVRCLPADRNPTRSVSEAPLLLGTICRSWRDISLSTPRLWTGIHIYIPRTQTVKYQSLSDLVAFRTQGVQRWLGRSGILPLSISLLIDYDLDSNPVSPLEEFTRALMQLSPRWGCLELRVPYPVLKILQQSLKPDDLPLLRDFRADLVDSRPLDDDADPPETLLQGFLAAPTLHSVAIVHYTHPARALLLPVSMTSLTSLAINSLGVMEKSNMFTTQEVLAILMQCKRLQRLNLVATMVHAGAEADHVLARIDLPDLVDLSLLIYGDDDAASSFSPSGSYHAFFARLYTPSLKSLVLAIYWYGGGDGGIGPYLPFFPLFSGHDSKLESLRTDLPISAEALVECLRLVPRLIALDANLLGTPVQGAAADAHLQLLIPTAESPIPLCPSLQTLLLSGGAFADTFGPSDETLLAFAQSRWRPTHPDISRLKTFSILLNRPMITDITSQVRVLQEEGMDLTINYQRTESDAPDEGAYSSRYFKLS